MECFKNDQSYSSGPGTLLWLTSPLNWLDGQVGAGLGALTFSVLESDDTSKSPWVVAFLTFTL